MSHKPGNFYQRLLARFHKVVAIPSGGARYVQAKQTPPNLASVRYVRAKQTPPQGLSSMGWIPAETYSTYYYGVPVEAQSPTLSSSHGASRGLKPQPVNQKVNYSLNAGTDEAPQTEQPQPQHVPGAGTPPPAVGAPHNVPAEPTPTHEIHDNPYRPPNLSSSHDASRGLNPQPPAKGPQPRKKPSLLRRLKKMLSKWPRNSFFH